MAQNDFDVLELQRGWSGQAPDRLRFSMVLVHCVEQSHRRDAASTGKKWTTQRWSERMEKAAHGVRTSDQCDGARIHDEVGVDSPREDDSRREQRDPDAGKYEEHRDNKYDNDLKLQRPYEILPRPIEQQLVLKDRDGSATFQSKSKQLDDESTRQSEQTWTCGRWETEVTMKTTKEEMNWTRQET